MVINNIILLYVTLLMLLSQTEFSKFTIFFTIPLLLTLIIRNPRMNSFSYRKIMPLNIIIFLGFLSVIVNLYEYDPNYIVKDIFYFIQAPIYITLGILLYEEIKDYKKILKITVLSSLAVTLYISIDLILIPDIISSFGFRSRYEYTLSNSATLITFFILFYSRKFKFKLFNGKIELLIITLSLLSVLISFSRITYVTFLLMLLIPYIGKSQIILKGYLALVIAICFLIFGGLLMEEKTQGGGEQGPDFQSKIMHSLDEIMVRNYDNIVEITNNWRGYEANLGLQKYYKSSPIELFFGQGYGAVVQTPYWVFGDAKNGLGVLPMFHNGYITILLKVGLFGLFLFFMWLYILLNAGARIVKIANTPQQKIMGTFLQAGVFTIIFQTLVIHGIFQTVAPMMLLFLIGVSLQGINTKRVRLKTK